MCGYEGATIPDPDSRDTIGGPTSVSDVATFISHTLKGVATQPSITEYCIFTVRSYIKAHVYRYNNCLPGTTYVLCMDTPVSELYICIVHANIDVFLSPLALYCAQMSPDMNPVIDRHPLHSNIFIAAGFSGINITM